MSISHAKLGSTWDAAKKHSWRTKNPDQSLIFHFVLDASPSMISHKQALITAYNMYIRWLQDHASPMSMAQMVSFSTRWTIHPLCPLVSLPLLTSHDYRPEDGDGTAIYNTLGALCLTFTEKAKHIIVLFTDGEDCAEDVVWTALQIRETLETLQDVDECLCIYLGAHQRALSVAQEMGFKPGNVLAFSSDQIAQAFRNLQHATQRYLTAAPAERKLLAAGGIF